MALIGLLFIKYTVMAQILHASEYDSKHPGPSIMGKTFCLSKKSLLSKIKLPAKTHLNCYTK